MLLVSVFVCTALWGIKIKKFDDYWLGMHR